MPDPDFKPLNREPPLSKLISSFITVEDGYDRNHGGIPTINEERHIVRIDGAVKNVLELSISQLRNDFKQYTVIKEVDGIDWFDGAVMNCKWRGPRLRDVLNKAMVTLPGKQQGHVAFASYAVPTQESDWYGSSIHLERAMAADADVILALEMNDKPLAVKHGFPCRVVTPGIAGARAVKWLDKITVQKDESSNFYQRRDYKILPPEVTDGKKAEQYWDKTPALQDMPVNSVIAVPESGGTASRAADGTINVYGYALPSGRGGPVVKVEVSTNCKDWKNADLIAHPDDSRWSWKFWKASIDIKAGQNLSIYSRATDVSGATQAKHSQWNLRGVGYNGYGEVNKLTIV